jgi:riboflavin biosynthesis pyrimidine reductase
MGMNNVQTNVLDAMQQKAMTLLDDLNTFKYISQMWVNEGLQSLADEEIQSLTTFAGVTATEALAAKQAFDAIVTTLGDPNTAGTNAYKLLKLANNIP